MVLIELTWIASAPFCDHCWYSLRLNVLGYQFKDLGLSIEPLKSAFQGSINWTHQLPLVHPLFIPLANQGQAHLLIEEILPSNCNITMNQKPFCHIPYSSPLNWGHTTWIALARKGLQFVGADACSESCNAPSPSLSSSLYCQCIHWFSSVLSLCINCMQKWSG